MKIKIKYDVGDKVRYWRINKEPIFANCGCCAGSGWVQGRDGYDYTCPECEGAGKIFVEYKEIKIEDECTIGTVHVHYDSDLYSKDGFGVVNIYYTQPHDITHIPQDNIIEKIEIE